MIDSSECPCYDEVQKAKRSGKRLTIKYSYSDMAEPRYDADDGDEDEDDDEYVNRLYDEGKQKYYKDDQERYEDDDDEEEERMTPPKPKRARRPPTPKMSDKEEPEAPGLSSVEQLLDVLGE